MLHFVAILNNKNNNIKGFSLRDEGNVIGLFNVMCLCMKTGEK